MKSYVGPGGDGKSLSSRQSAFAGACSGFVTRVLVQPLDVVKIRLQLQVEPTARSGGGYYRGVWQALWRIGAEEGGRALWRGHGPAQALTVLYGAGQFSSYNMFTRIALDENMDRQDRIKRTTNVNTTAFARAPDQDDIASSMRQCSLPVTSVCGALAGVCGTLVSMPCDTARTRIVAQSTAEPATMLSTWRRMVKVEGPLSLWRGLLPTLASTVPFAAIQFPIYTALMSLLSGLSANESVLVPSAVSGGLAGLGAKLVVYPLDLLKKRVQMSGAEHSRAGYGKVVVYTNAWDILRRVVKEEGARGCYKGLSPSLLKSTLVSGLSFLTYELSSNVIHNAANR